MFLRAAKRVQDGQPHRYFSSARLFPDGRTPPPDPVPAVQVRWQEYELRPPRADGAAWLAGELWRQLGLDTFWTGKLGWTREGTDWARTLLVSVACRLIAPGSEWRCWRLWYERTALGDLLGPDFHLGNKDQLYAMLDRLPPHRVALFQHLRARWPDLFGVKCEVLRHDLTRTCFEGAAAAATTQAGVARATPAAAERGARTRSAPGRME
jgi:hypothetical protein